MSPFGLLGGLLGGGAQGGVSGGNNYQEVSADPIVVDGNADVSSGENSVSVGGDVDGDVAPIDPNP